MNKQMGLYFSLGDSGPGGNEGGTDIDENDVLEDEGLDGGKDVDADESGGSAGGGGRR